MSVSFVPKASTEELDRVVAAIIKRIRASRKRGSRDAIRKAREQARYARFK